MAVTYTPEVEDIVRVGKHGKVMRVREVFPTAKAAVLVAKDDSRLLVDWHEVTEVVSALRDGGVV